jgi:hypothetical protein
MKKKPTPILLGVVVAIIVLVIAPFILWGEHPDHQATGTLATQESSVVIVYAAGSSEGVLYSGLTSAVGEMAAGIPVGSAVANSAVYGGNVIIARNHDTWRTIPGGALFYFDASACRADVFIDRPEFTVFLKKYPELARAGARALELDEFLQALREKQTLSAKDPL